MCPIKFTSTVAKFSIEILLEERKRVLTEKHDDFTMEKNQSC